jgi:hypothetical protein
MVLVEVEGISEGEAIKHDNIIVYRIQVSTKVAKASKSLLTCMRPHWVGDPSI